MENLNNEQVTDTTAMSEQEAKQKARDNREKTLLNVIITCLVVTCVFLSLIVYKLEDRIATLEHNQSRIVFLIEDITNILDTHISR